MGNILYEKSEVIYIFVLKLVLFYKLMKNSNKLITKPIKKGILFLILEGIFFKQVCHFYSRPNQKDIFLKK